MRRLEGRYGVIYSFASSLSLLIFAGSDLRIMREVPAPHQDQRVMNDITDCQQTNKCNELFSALLVSTRIVIILNCCTALPRSHRHLVPGPLVQSLMFTTILMGKTLWTFFMVFASKGGLNYILTK